MNQVAQSKNLTLNNSMEILVLLLRMLEQISYSSYKKSVLL